MSVTKQTCEASHFCLLVHCMVAVMNIDDDENTKRPGPSTFWTWYCLKALQKGVQLMVEGLVGVGASDSSVHALSLVSGMNDGYEHFGRLDENAICSDQGRVKLTSTTYLADRSLKTNTSTLRSALPPQPSRTPSCL